MGRTSDWLANHRAEYKMGHEFVEYHTMLPRWEAEVLTFIHSKWGHKKTYWVGTALEIWLMAIGFVFGLAVMAVNESNEEGQALIALAILLLIGLLIGQWAGWGFKRRKA